ncbi:unnamed protein product, partial [Nesidiocoris tenuis]
MIQNRGRRSKFGDSYSAVCRAKSKRLSRGRADVHHADGPLLLSDRSPREGHRGGDDDASAPSGRGHGYVRGQLKHKETIVEDSVDFMMKEIIRVTPLQCYFAGLNI